MASGPYKHLFNFRRVWFLAVFITAGVTLLPLIFITIMDYRATQKGIESEIRLRTARLVSNTRRSVSFFLEERQSALNFIIQLHPWKDLNNPEQLELILDNLKNSFGGFVDLGIIDADGVQKTYVGPYDLKGKNYRDQEWFKQVVEKGGYISDVFMGFRREPHLVIARKHKLADGSYHVLRATLDTGKFAHLIYGLEMTGKGDAFLINHQGALQTPSWLYGPILNPTDLSVPKVSSQTEVYEWQDQKGNNLVIGYAYISDSPFILMIVKFKKELIKDWYSIRMELIGFLIISITVILIVILGTATYLVGQVFDADQRRVAMLHQVEYANKMSSIGRLAAGVAHEINNPLAIINEKAGLVKDIFHYKKEYQHDPRLMETMDAILNSVERCSRITRQLLNFARHMNVSVQQINLKSLVQEVLGFLAKEAEYRSIAVVVDIKEDIPDFESDRGKLQQILLNIINNAFAAMTTGGSVTIRAKAMADARVQIEISDTGCGISRENLKFIFEPFFSTKTEVGGTGLGLSITYSLAKELGGRIEVESKVGVGTTFIINLPMKLEKKEQ